MRKLTWIVLTLTACNQAVDTTNEMQFEFNKNGKTYTAQFDVFHDLSIPIDTNGPLAWYLNQPEIEAVRDENWVGVVAEGGSVNFRNIHFNPHGHGTHTEGPGHVEPTVYSIDRAVKSYHVFASVITVEPEVLENGDQVITWEMLKKDVESVQPEAVIIRSSAEDRRNKNWSNTNPTYLQASAAKELANHNVLHILVDLPSVDREQDEGRLEAHKAFWNIPDNVRMEATITELIHVPADVKDGTYLLNLQIGPFVNDAAPSRPIIFPLE